ncbi:MAG TPA: SUMF1/EgtB/PvdO family nonheme iron enzyme [Opitutaceae bacterium]
MADHAFLRPDDFTEMGELPTMAMPSPEHLLVRGRLVFGRYELLREVGRGGMGVVWAARDTRLEMVVALKFLPDAVARDPEALCDLRRETRCALELTHPHIVRAYTIEQEPGLAAIVMELVEGQSLAHRKAAAPTGSLTVDELSPLTSQLCDALDYAHRRARMAHRDLKPGNLLVDSRGELKISDFGIARSLTETRTRLTGKAGLTSGTLLYMSPQQLLGYRATAADDLYALGATLYDLLTGKPPFFRGDLATQIQQAQPEPLMRRRESLGHSGPPIPRHWESTIFACLSKDPAQRPDSAARVGQMLGVKPFVPPPAPAAGPGELTQALEAPTVPARATASVAAAAMPEPRRRSGLLAWSLVLCGAAACAAAVTLTWRTPPWVAGWLSALPARAQAALSLLPEAVPKRAEPPPVAPALAREFVIEVEPVGVPARVWLGPAADLAVPPDGRLRVADVPDGEHELIVQAPGYEPFATHVAIVDGRGHVQANLEAVRGTLVVVARPGTEVYATDMSRRTVSLGTVNDSGELVAENVLVIGYYALRFEHPDCAPVTLRGVEVVVGRHVYVAPAQAPPPAELRVFSVPTGASVWVDGREVGVTPATVRELPSDQPVAVEVRHPGYRAYRQEVSLKPKEVRTLNVGTLVAQAGRLVLHLPRGANPREFEVLIDGRGVLEPALMVSEAEGPALRIEQVDVGPCQIEVRHPDYRPWMGEVMVRDQETTIIEVELESRPAALVLDVIGPENFELRVNGLRVEPHALSREAVDGQPPMVSASYTFEPGTVLALEAVASGYQPARRTVTLESGRSERLALRMERYLGPTLGKPWTIPVLEMELVPIAPGSGQIGSIMGVGNDERPVTRVTLTKPYWLGKTEVTQAQWQRLMGTTVRQLRARAANSSWPLNSVGRNFPIYYVTWSEAAEFCAQLTERERAAGRLPEGYAYSLPTEAQWEYACRAGSSSDYPDVLEELAWFSGNSGGRVHPVGLKRANAWGLHDMHGNVWEWCADWYASTLPGGDVSDPLGPSSGNYRVGRGGSWNGSPLYCHSAVRTRREPADRGYDIGFRVALSPAVSEERLAVR